MTRPGSTLPSRTAQSALRALVSGAPIDARFGLFRAGKYLVEVEARFVRRRSLSAELSLGSARGLLRGAGRLERRCESAPAQKKSDRGSDRQAEHQADEDAEQRAAASGLPGAGHFARVPHRLFANDWNYFTSSSERSSRVRPVWLS